MSIRDSLRFTEEHLASANIAEAKIEAELIWMHVLSVARYELYLDGLPEVTYSTADKVQQIVSERITGKPLAYVLGIWKSYNIDMVVSPDVLIPRPETEILIERGIEVCNSGLFGKSPVVGDIGTGCGSIAINLMLNAPAIRLFATDNSRKALTIARQNFKRFDLYQKITVLHGDLLEPIFALPDLVIGNLPYIPSRNIGLLQQEVRWEPRIALDGGYDGLSCFRKIAVQSRLKLNKARVIFLLEMDPHQIEDVEFIFKEQHSEARFDVIRDLRGLDRVLEITIGI